MKNLCEKSIVSIIILILAIASVFVAFPIVTAHEPSWTVPTYAYITVNPNPVGVGQPVFVIMWINRPPPSAAGVGGDRWQGYEVEITRPDGSKENLGPFTSDATSSYFLLYTPDQVGTYNFDFTFPGQIASLYHPESGVAGSSSDYINDTFTGSSASTTLTVQQEPLAHLPTVPLPTEYWTRPIEGQNTEWASIASNWLQGGQLTGSGWANLWQQDGIAPNSAHIMWTKPIEFGGIVGGTTAIPGVGYYSGGSYEGRFDNAIIMHGRLYYPVPLGHAQNGGGYACLDLRTGEEIWYSDVLGVNGTAYPTKGQIYEYESFNQHGVVGGVLWQTVGRTWNAFDPFTGLWMYTLTNVPSGTEVYTERGEIVRYVLNYAGRWLALWNNTAEQQGLHGDLGTGSSAYQWRPNGKTVDMSNAYSWNVTIPDLPGTSSPSIVKVLPGDLILGRSSAIGLKNSPTGTDDPYTVWALSDRPETRGQLLWIKNYPAPEGNITRMLAAQPIDTINRVFTMTDYETGQRLGYDLDTGDLLWGPVGVPYSEVGASAFQYYSSRSGFPAYGNLYVGGFGGEILCYSMKNGTLLWKYDNTFSGLETPWGKYPTPIYAIADGKVFAFSNEHSPNYPIYKGEKTRVIDAFTGEEIWTLSSMAGTRGGGRNPTSLVAEGFTVFYNFYDNQLYCIGKGPSKTTVSIQNDVIPIGNTALIKGTVTDTSSGTNQNEQATRFPNGVPAMSDESMSQWMEYVYMQKPCPADVEGVEVVLTTLDPNNNFYEIGRVKSDAYGMYSILWEPPVPGKYAIYATFEGSESYYMSYAETAIYVGPPISAGGPIEPEEPSADIISTELAMILAIVVIAAIGIVAFWVLRKRK
jgi:hypothetical protein